MHILHIIPGDLWAGAESQLFYTLREIRKQCNHSIAVILFNGGELYRRLNHENIDVTIIDEEKYSGPEIIRQLSGFLSRYNVDILHTHEYKSHILGVLAKTVAGKRCPVIRTLHGHTSVPLRFNTLKSYSVLQMDNIFLRFFTQHIIAVSNELKAELENTFTRPAVHYINNAVNIERHDIIAHDTIRIEMGIADPTLWIVTAARLVRVKNLDMLIEAAGLLKKKNRAADFTVSIFGEGELRASLEEKVRAQSLEDKVMFYGHNNNIYHVFKAADIFTLTSHDEGMPMSLLEAMSLGAVPVCTGVGGMKEVIRNGENGFLVNTGDPAELADVLDFLIRNRDRLACLRQKAVSTISQNYSLEKSTAKLIGLYSTICKTE